MEWKRACSRNSAPNLASLSLPVGAQRSFAVSRDYNNRLLGLLAILGRSVEVVLNGVASFQGVKLSPDLGTATDDIDLRATLLTFSTRPAIIVNIQSEMVSARLFSRCLM